MVIRARRQESTWTRLQVLEKVASNTLANGLLSGGSSYSTSQGTTPSTHSSFQSGGSNLDPFTGGSSYTTVMQKNVQMVESKFFPLTVYRTFDMGNPQIVLNKLKEFNEEAKGHSTFMDERQLERLVDMCDGPSTDPNSVDMLFKLLEWPDGDY